jgi:hypothetical protein
MHLVLYEYDYICLPLYVFMINPTAHIN